MSITVFVAKHLFHEGGLSAILDVLLALADRFGDRTVPLEVRLGALRLYRAHLVSQYADRCAFWALKDISSEVMAGTITMITDGADQVSKRNA